MSAQAQQQQPPQPQQPGPPGIGMGRGASNTGLQNSTLPLNNNNPHHPGPISQQSLQEAEEEAKDERLLNSYIYEHLLKSGFYQAARGLLNEASLQLGDGQHEDSSPNQDNDVHLTRRAINLKRSHSGLDNHPNAIPNDKANGKSPRSGSDSPNNEQSDLPPADGPLNGAGQMGFLRRWWAVFWDIYSARSSMGTPSPWAQGYLDTQAFFKPCHICLIGSAVKAACLNFTDRHNTTRQFSNNDRK